MPDEPQLPRRCTITLDIRTGLHIRWDPPLPDGPHRVNWVEAAAAGALIGIGKAITGKGYGEIIQALKKLGDARPSASTSPDPE